MKEETKQMLLGLLEDIPDEIIAIKYMSSSLTVGWLRDNIDSEESKQFFADLFRISRDIIKRKAQKQ